MAHHDHVHIIVDHLDGVLEGLALALAGVGSVRESDHLGSQAVDGGLEAEPGSGRRLEEEACDDLSFKEVLYPVLLELLGGFQDMEDFLLAEVPDRNQTFVIHIAYVVL